MGIAALLMPLVIQLLACGSSPATTPAPATQRPPTPIPTTTPRSEPGLPQEFPDPTWTSVPLEVLPQPASSTGVPEERPSLICDSEVSQPSALNMNLDRLLEKDYGVDQLNPLLARIVRSATDYQDIVADGTVYRYTLTFISQDLLYAAYLKAGAELGPSLDENKTLAGQIDPEASVLLSELRFLVTVSALNPMVDQQIALPVASMRLRNTYGQDFLPLRWDRGFDVEVSIAKGPRFGFVMFPAMTRTEAGECLPTIDFYRDTSITVFAPGVKSGNVTGYLNWTIPFVAVLDSGLEMPQPTSPITTAIGNASITNEIVGPVLPTPTGDTTPDDTYWLQFSEFVLSLLAPTMQ